jgi:biotin-dependent carboxylase-like uncharacterized protein
MSLEILNNPIYCIIQNQGNFKYTHLGVSASGVMDEYSFHIANKLLNNTFNTNIMEINFPNVIFKINKDTSIAITGAKCEFYINDILYNTWQVFQVKTGDIIKIGKILSGLRVYLSVKDGFIVQKEIWGYSTDKLKKNDILQYNGKITINKRLKEKFIPRYENELQLRVMLSYQHAKFSNEEKDKFFSNIYIVTSQINNMGYKLKGNAISCTINDIVSEGIAYGSIQIPKDGQPIILLKNRQTIGGYPKIGVVLDIDCFRLAQKKSNTKISFKEISFEDGIKKSKLFYNLFNSYKV